MLTPISILSRPSSHFVSLAAVVALLTMLLFTQSGLAGAGEHRTLQLLLNKGIITQQEYDQAVQEEERAKVEEEQRVLWDPIGRWFRRRSYPDSPAEDFELLPIDEPNRASEDVTVDVGVTDSRLE